MPDRLNPNEGLAVNKPIISQDGRFTFILQGDGNVVLYGPSGAPLWATDTAGRTVSQAIMQGDGNFVIYGPEGAIWDTKTHGHQGAWLIVQNDGNVVIYSLDGKPLWDTKTHNTNIAIVFVNRTITPDFNTKFVGHVGWGFERADGYIMYGSKEATPTEFQGYPPGKIPKGKPNGVFIIKKGKFVEMRQAIKSGGYQDGPRFLYHQYKLLKVRDPNISAAINMAEDSKHWGYDWDGNNCMDDVYKIITAYANGDKNFLPWPPTHWFPNHFFDDIKASCHVLNPHD